MERNRNAALLFLPLALVCVGVGETFSCPSDPDTLLPKLTCYNDFNRVITCVWNSSSASGRPDRSACTVLARRTIPPGYPGRGYSSSCRLQPLAASPVLRTCSMNFSADGWFQTFHKLSINLSCNLMHTWYMPACHVKLSPPPQPRINGSSVSCVPRAAASGRLTYFTSQLQWKHKAQSWTDTSVQNFTDQKWNTLAELQLEPDQLTRGEQYEARTRVKASDTNFGSTWSDWSPVASWVSHAGRAGRAGQRQSDLNVGVLVLGAAAAAFAVFLVVVRFKTDKSTWVHMVRKISGPPLPDPAKSFLRDVDFQSCLSPHFTGESLHSTEVVSVEVTSAVDAVVLRGPEEALLEKMRSDSRHESTSSNFSNPSYSQLCPPPPPPVSSLTAGNLPPCVADTPYGPVGGQGGMAEQEARGQEEVKVRLLLSEGGNGSESMPVVSDYERAEKVQVERVRLQSLDSGVCSGEEVSLEADSMNLMMMMEEEEESKGGDGKEVDLQKLFRGGEGGLGDGSIRVCSGYERVPELLSTDSGVAGVGEEEDVDESSESTCLLLPPPPPPPPPPPSSSPCFLPLFPPPPPLSDFSGSGLSPALRLLPILLLDRTSLTTSRPVEPSGDGYV